MFQSDDFDDILSDESFAKIDNDILSLTTNERSSDTNSKTKQSVNNVERDTLKSIDNNLPTLNRSIAGPSGGVPLNMNLHNGIKRKRKFPGPAGLLPAGNQDTLQCNLIQSSQSSSQTPISSTVFDEGPWHVMKDDLAIFLSQHKELSYFTIEYIKEQALAQRLTGHKVPLLAGVIQTLDRTLQDPSIILRDSSAEIQCTLHRDAWEMLGCYLIPQYSVMLLKHTTVLTTGAPLKKHYLNITINNIVGIYCMEENLYSNNNKSKSDTEVENNVFSSEFILWDSNKVIVLRNISTRESSKINNETNFIKNIYNTRAEEDEIAENFLNGINPESLFDEFD